jgi:hypothetical protein
VSVYELKRVASREEPIIWGYSELMELGDEYLISDDGALIDSEGSLVWDVRWDHYFSDAIYIKDKQILLTNRLINFGMGGEFSLGIACIDMKTGKYKWRHFYDQYKSKMKLRNREPDINMVRGLDALDINQNCIYTDGFKVNIEDGSHEYTGIDKVRRVKGNENILYSESAKSLKHMLHMNTEITLMINIRVNIININGLEFSKEGYFFNKCNFVIDTKDHIYFWGVPARKNPKNTVLFKYSKALNTIEDEIEMPFRYPVDEVYDFFGRGILIIARKTIWLSKDFNL